MRNCIALVLGNLCSFLLLGLLAAPWSHADTLRASTSLQWVPATTGFYVALLRNGEQWERFQQSKAYAKLQSLPFVQMAIAGVQAKLQEPGSPMAQCMEFIQDPENADLVLLAKDALQHEVMILGDDRVGTLLLEANRLNRLNQTKQLELLNDMEADGTDQEQFQQEVVKSIVHAANSIEVPNVLLGFRVSDPDLAKSQLPRIAQMIRETMEDEPGLAQRLVESQSGDTPYLQLTLHGEMIPWDEMLENARWPDEQVEALKNALSNREVHLTLGVRDNYLFMLMGAIKDPNRIFAARQLLIDRPELKRLRDMDGKPFTAISYVSDDFMQKASRPQEDIEQIAIMADALIPRANLDEEIERSLINDARELANDLKRMIPRTGAVVSFEYLTDSGYEGYSQNWTENLFLDGSKPLDLLRHIGGDPIAVFIWRGKTSTVGDGFFTKWMSRAIRYSEYFAMQNDPDEEVIELFEAFKTAMAPFADRLATVSKTYWQPAMADRQSGIVVDAKIEPKRQWHPAMPDLADEPLGMFEFAEVRAVSDVKALETALGEFKRIAEEALEALKTVTRDHQETIAEHLSGQAVMLPMIIQGLRLPTPREEQTADGKLFSLTALAAMGLDPSIAPAWGWSDRVLVFATTPAAVARLMSDRAETQSLAEMTDRPLAGASYVSIARFIQTLKPWVRYGMTVAAESQDNPMIATVTPQVEAILDVAACFDHVTSVTFEDENSLVTHYRQGFRDLE